MALGLRLARMGKDDIGKMLSKLRHQLGREGDLWYEDNHRPACSQSVACKLDIHCRLAATRHTVKEYCARAGLADCANGLFLLRIKRENGRVALWWWAGRAARRAALLGNASW